MTIEDLRGYRFQTSISDGDEIKCPSCGEFSPHSEWEDSESYCDDCGSHPASMCPKCGCIEDYVWHDPLETRTPSERKDDE